MKTYGCLWHASWHRARSSTDSSTMKQVSRPRRCLLHVCIRNIVRRMRVCLLINELESKALLASALMVRAHKFHHVQHIPVEGQSCPILSLSGQGGEAY